MGVILGGISGELDSPQKYCTLDFLKKRVSLPCQMQLNRLSGILSSLRYSTPEAIFGETCKVYKDKFILVLYV